MVSEAKDLSSREKALIIAEVADDKRALEIVTLDLQGITLVADFFVICSGTSDVHIRAITEGIEEALKKGYRIYPTAVQGRTEANWVILDYGDVVVHVFSEVERVYYDLESFWQNARVVQRVLAGRPAETDAGHGIDTPEINSSGRPGAAETGSSRQTGESTGGTPHTDLAAGTGDSHGTTHTERLDGAAGNGHTTEPEEPGEVEGGEGHPEE